MATRRLALVTCLFLFTLSTALAQDENKPFALLKRDSNGAAFSIKVQTNVKPTAGSRLSAILSNKNSLVMWQQDVQDCHGREPGKFCKKDDAEGHVELEFPLSAVPDRSDKFSVSFAIIDSAGRGSFCAVDVIGDVLPDFKTLGPALDPQCTSGLRVMVTFASPILTQDANVDYYTQRLRVFDAWFTANQSSPQGIATVKIEPMTEGELSEFPIKSFAPWPVTRAGANSQSLDIETAMTGRQFGICLNFAKKLPDGKYNAKIVFKNNPPAELEDLPPIALNGPKVMVVQSSQAITIAQDTKLDRREIGNNLDLGILFTSSVKETKIGKQVIRERQSRGAIDLRFAPIIQQRMRSPGERKLQPFWTPIFVDAKVATGSITADSLSLNRILVGTDLTLRYYPSTQRKNRDKYLIAIRGLNYSDRDYKRAEMDGGFEFKPIFHALNKQLLARQSLRSELIPQGPQRELPAKGWFSYEIRPIVGFDLGQVYRKHRSTIRGEELGDTVRRLVLGMDMAFGLGSKVALRATERFYLRGNVTGGARTRNYFNGTLEFPIGSNWRNSAQCLFLSFERGDQPPFSTPSVDALKFGYRLRSDFFSWGTAR